MSFCCFPVSLQAMPISPSAASPGLQIDLAGEFTDSVIDMASRLKKRNNTKGGMLKLKVPVGKLAQNIALASNPLPDPSLLMVLARDQDSLVRTEAIFNSATPEEVLRERASDGDRFVAGQARVQLAA